MRWGGYHGSVSGQRPNTNKIHTLARNADKHKIESHEEIMEKHPVRNTNTAPKAMRSMLCSDITLVESLSRTSLASPMVQAKQLPKYN